MNDSIDIINLVSEFTSDKNAVNNENMTPFYVAAIHCDSKTFDYFRQLFKPNIQHTDIRGANILHWAVRQGNAEKISFLMDTEINVNARALDSRTPCEVPIAVPMTKELTIALEKLKKRQDIIKVFFIYLGNF